MTIVTIKGHRIKVSAIILISSDNTKLCFNDADNKYTEILIKLVSHIEPE